MNNWQNSALKFLAISAFPLLTTTAWVAPSNANTLKFACNIEGNAPTIVASSLENDTVKEATLIQFPSKYFSREDGISKCQTTANKLQKLYNTDSASYLASDSSNGQPVVCAVARRGSSCNSYNAEILFTLAQGTDPSSALYDMLDSKVRQSHPRPDSRTVSRLYTDITPSVWNTAPTLKWWPF
jgi:hypothetical protein